MLSISGNQAPYVPAKSIGSLLVPVVEGNVSEAAGPCEFYSPCYIQAIAITRNHWLRRGHGLFHLPLFTIRQEGSWFLSPIRDRQVKGIYIKAS